MTRNNNGTWSEKVIYTFTLGFVFPNGYLVIDPSGNIFGADQVGGSFGSGEVFELSPGSGGTWIETTVHSFNISNGDGWEPFGGVILDGKGNLYGTTVQGGAGRFGVVFELSPQSNGQWSETLLYNFMNVQDGADPESPLTFDAAGNLYGTTWAGGTSGGSSGSVFKLTPNANGTWTESTIYDFGPYPDGQNPSGPVVFDSKGNLYGAVSAGGKACNVPGCGIIYRLTPQAQGTWKETILYQPASALDGSVPEAGVLLDESHQRLFLTTAYGGSRFGYGTIIELKAGK